jgi:hypothetical protein
VLFEKRLQEGLTDGTITVALRRWKRPQVLPGRQYRSPVGMVAVTDVQVVDTIDEATARAAGFASVEEALADLPGDGPITVLTMHLAGEPDPRDELSHDTHIADVEKLKRQIERYRPHFDLIAEFPGRRAPDLAEMLGKETLVFKREVRRLKELGLTHSLRVGYRVSPRGEALRTLLD